MEATSFGHIDKFQPANESFTTYLECIDLLFTGNDMDAETRVPVFLSVIGERTYALLCNLLALVKLGKIPFFGLAEMLQKCFEPTRIVFAEWFHFHR